MHRLSEHSKSGQERLNEDEPLRHAIPTFAVQKASRLELNEASLSNLLLDTGENASEDLVR